MHCNQCGNLIKPEAFFCSKCGAKATQNAEPVHGQAQAFGDVNDLNPKDMDSNSNLNSQNSNNQKINSQIFPGQNQIQTNQPIYQNHSASNQNNQSNSSSSASVKKRKNPIIIIIIIGIFLAVLATFLLIGLAVYNGLKNISNSGSIQNSKIAKLSSNHINQNNLNQETLSYQESQEKAMIDFLRQLEQITQQAEPTIQETTAIQLSAVSAKMINQDKLNSYFTKVEKARQQIENLEPPAQGQQLKELGVEYYSGLSQFGQALNTLSSNPTKQEKESLLQIRAQQIELSKQFFQKTKQLCEKYSII
ncbi:MAG: hypothetical protein GF332_04725 [Candidatus Moranbacteria bacterium]|nr:hypothetical protein [Candidatus Moranbacteria bacterium]